MGDGRVALLLDHHRQIIFNTLHAFGGPRQQKRLGAFVVAADFATQRHDPAAGINVDPSSLELVVKEVLCLDT